jgi:beta-lactamase regulating signal transducer with metallopeptidase domain
MDNAALIVCARVTVVLALTAVALFSSRRSTAATRHLIAMAGLAGALLVLVLPGSLPELELPILPRGHMLANPPEPASHGAPLARSIFPQAWPWIAALWTAGSALLLARLAVGMLRFSRWCRLASPDGVAQGARGKVRVLVSDRAAVPMTAGILSPVILLPPQSREWTVERRRLVLGHELAHAQRFDSLAVLVAETATALFWLHPLVWLVRRRARVEAEQAADDVVLAAGETPSLYARHLVAIASSLRAPSGAVPMARTHELEGRLQALLDLRDRGASSRSGRAICLALLGVSLALSAVRPISRIIVTSNCERAQSVLRDQP